MREVLRRRPLTAFVTLTYVLSWGVWIPGFLSAGPSPAIDDVLGWLVLGSTGPSLAGLTMSAVTGGRPAVRAMLRRVVAVRGRSWWLWVLAFVGGYPVLLLLTLALDPEQAATAGRVVAVSVAVAVPISVVNVVLGPLGEEIGWRGFALPTLLRSRRPLTAALLVALVWAPWHAPLALLSDWSVGDPVVWWILYPVSIAAFSCVLTYLHLRGSGSLLLVILAHSGLNTLLATAADLQDEGVADGVPEVALAVGAAAVLAVPFAVALWRSRRWPASPDVPWSIGSRSDA